MAEITKIQGMESVSRKLRALPRKVQRKVLLKALRAGMRPISRTARLSVPVETGLLKRMIRTRAVPIKNTRKGRRLQLGVKVNRSGRGSGTDAFYWRFVEFGTEKWSGKQFLRPALENNRFNAARIIKTGIRQGVEAQARR